jgi:hypothetical protein
MMRATIRCVLVLSQAQYIVLIKQSFFGKAVDKNGKNYKLQLFMSDKENYFEYKYLLIQKPFSGFVSVFAVNVLFYG